MTTDSPKIERALISVSDKTALIELAQALAKWDIEILSTGGSAKALRAAGLVVTEVSTHTDFPEIMDGRVKTLHPTIHGGLLARRDLDSHRQAMRDHGIAPIDLLVVNLYPFAQTVATGAQDADCLEQIDIGGPAMIRAAAKNHAFVTVVTDPADYDTVIDNLNAGTGATTPELRRTLAARAYGHTAAYDSMVAGWFEQKQGNNFPPQITWGGQRQTILRYGENPHQMAALYRSPQQRPGVASAVKCQGKALSYNNLNDTDAAFELVSEFSKPSVAIIKHANPCGVASADSLQDAWDKALSCDPVSAFGGIIAVNRTVDAATAHAICALFAEVVIAPDIEQAAAELFATKKNLRVLKTGTMADPAAGGMTMKSIAGGFLLQSRDCGRVSVDDFKVVTKRAPTKQENEDLLFAFRVGKHVKSNAIVYAKNTATVGIGAGQMSRVDSSRIAAWKAAEASEKSGQSQSATEDSVVSSDAFFPFADGLLAAAAAGATAVIQPGGSLRDDEIIAAADDADLAMVFTGLRHFRH